MAFYRNSEAEPIKPQLIDSEDNPTKFFADLGANKVLMGYFHHQELNAKVLFIDRGTTTDVEILNGQYAGVYHFYNHDGPMDAPSGSASRSYKGGYRPKAESDSRKKNRFGSKQISGARR
jgi:hypothetical protein